MDQLEGRKSNEKIKAAQWGKKHQKKIKNTIKLKIQTALAIHCFDIRDFDHSHQIFVKPTLASVIKPGPENRGFAIHIQIFLERNLRE